MLNGFASEKSFALTFHTVKEKNFNDSKNKLPYVKFCFHGNIWYCLHVHAGSMQKEDEKSSSYHLESVFTI